MNEKKDIWKCTPESTGERIDSALSRLHFGISRNQWKKLIKDGMIRIGGKNINPSYILKTGDIVEITIPPPEPLEVEPEDISLDILYEDDSVLVINKPQGLVVHPAAGHSKHTLVNAILFHSPNLSGIGGKQRPGIVHRLDKNTSGILMVAKTQHAHNSLSLQLREKRVKRVYLALVHGIFRENEGSVHTLIARHKKDRKRMSISTTTGKDAQTFWKIKEKFLHFTLLELRLKTGRTHQIRVHMSFLKHPVVGDTFYGKGRLPSTCSPELRQAIASLNGQALHAHALGFNHPVTGQYLEFSSPLPDKIQKILTILREEDA